MRASRTGCTSPWRQRASAEERRIRGGPALHGHVEVIEGLERGTNIPTGLWRDGRPGRTLLRTDPAPILQTSRGRAAIDRSCRVRSVLHCVDGHTCGDPVRRRAAPRRLVDDASTLQPARTAMWAFFTSRRPAACPWVATGRSARSRWGGAGLHSARRLHPDPDRDARHVRSVRSLGGANPATARPFPYPLPRDHAAQHASEHARHARACNRPLRDRPRGSVAPDRDGRVRGPILPAPISRTGRGAGAGRPARPATSARRNRPCGPAAGEPARPRRARAGPSSPPGPARPGRPSDHRRRSRGP